MADGETVNLGIQKMQKKQDISSSTSKGKNQSKSHGNLRKMRDLLLDMTPESMTVTEVYPSDPKKPWFLHDLN